MLQTKHDRFVTANFDIPMPGTTCFFDRNALVEISALRIEQLGDAWDDDDRAWAADAGLSGIKPWDPTNVTEDFEIGLLLCAYGFTPGHVPAVTKEESPLELDDWIRQRTRWQKGKLFTFLRYRNRLPDGLAHKFHFLYHSLLPHLGPINISAIVIIFILSRLLAYEPLPIVRVVLSVGLAFAVMAVGFNLLGYWLASDAPSRTRLRRSVVVAVGVFPYWLLQWGADIRALHQTYVGRFHWEHTTHLGRNLTDAITDGRGDGDFRPTYTLPGLRRELLLGAILLVGLALRMPQVGSQSLWTDEIYSVAVRSSLSFSELLVMPQDPHPPLYYALLRAWMELFGATPLAARSLSVVFSILAVYLGYLLGTRLYDDRTGLLVAAFLAVSVFHVHFGRTARMYSLFVLLTLVSWYGLLDVRSGSVIQRIGYAVAAAGVLYTHAFGVFVVAAQWLYLAVTASESADRAPERQAALGVGILSLPLVYLLGRVLLQMLTGTGPSLDWIPAPSIDLLGRISLLYAGYPDIYPILAGTTATKSLAALVGTVFVVAAGLSLFVYDPDTGFSLPPPRANAQMVALAVVPTLGPLLLSVLYQPVLVPRYTIPASIGVFVLVARGLTTIPFRALRVGVIVLVLGGFVTMSGAYHTTDTFEDWQGASSFIETGADPGDAVIYQPEWTETDVSYYYDGPELTAYRFSSADTAVSDRQQRQLRGILRQHETVWYVQYSAPYDAPTSQWLRDNAQQKAVRDFGIVTVYRFTSTQGTATNASDATESVRRFRPIL